MRWSGSTARSRSAHATVEHRLVGQAQALQHHDGLVGLDVDGQLDVRQHVAPVALGDEQRPPLARGLDREPPAVDQADAGASGSTPSAAHARSR